jgi:hypothetical protein
MGRTVEKYKNKTERGHKEQHITQSLLHRWGLLKNTLDQTLKKGITKEQHITQSLLS